MSNGIFAWVQDAVNLVLERLDNIALSLARIADALERRTADE